tara:strand:+ start:2286 stop:2678 length:393 start_codon:yes stop_codon:yes gene_type:complete
MKSFIEDSEIVGVVALLVHASKLDENYTNDEKKIIKNFISNISKSNEPEKILDDAEKLEGDSNQILNFTKLIKNKPIEFKKKIIKELWKLLISDKNIDQYEANLMRRISGLIYIDDKTTGELKLQVLKTN